MNNSLPTMQQAAEEAEFQLCAAKDVLEWQHALIKAMHLDHLHDSGKGIGTLFEVAKYFSDTGFGGVYSAIDQFKELGESAPQNANMSNRGAPSESGPDQTLAERMLLARNSADLTQADLAKACRISQANISEIERGEVGRTSYLPEIARACGVSTDWLAFGNECTSESAQ